MTQLSQPPASKVTKPEDRPRYPTAGSLFVVNTTTQKKYYDIAEIIEGLKLPFRVIPIQALNESCNSPPEVAGTLNGNAEIKQGSGALAASHMFSQSQRRQARLSEGYAHTQEMRRHMKGLGIDRNPPFFVLSEDSGVAMKLPENFFDHFDMRGIQGHMLKIVAGRLQEFESKAIVPAAELEELRRQADETALLLKEGFTPDSEKKLRALLKAAKAYDYAFPHVETGPLMRDAGGVFALMSRVKSALNACGHDSEQNPIPIRAHSIIRLQPMQPAYSDKSGTRERFLKPFRAIEFSEHTDLLMTFEALRNSTHEKEAMLTLEHFMKLPGRENSVAEMEADGLKYTLNYSPRVQIFRKLADRISGKKPDLPAVGETTLPLHDASGAAAANATPSLRVAVIQCRGGKDVHMTIAPWSALKENLGSAQDLGLRRLSPSSMDAAGLPDMQKLSHAADAFLIIPPPVAQDHAPDAALLQQYIISSLQVAKQLEVPCYDKSIIVHTPSAETTNGTPPVLRRALNASYDLFRRIMVNGTPGISPAPLVQASGHPPRYNRRDFIIESHAFDTVKNVLNDAELRMERFVRPPLPDNGKMSLKLEGETKPRIIQATQDVQPHGPDSNRINFAVFCSASSEHDINLKEAHTVSYGLADRGFGVVFGAGNRYMMGAVLKGVTDWRRDNRDLYTKDRRSGRGWIGGSSTNIILGRESDGGQIPEGLSQFYLAPTIYKRMDYLSEKSHGFIIMDGGPGTKQEAARMLLQRNRYPHKPFIVVNREVEADGRGCWDIFLKSLLASRGTEQRLLPLDKDREIHVPHTPSLHLSDTERKLLISQKNIYVVDTAEQALELAEQLAPHMSQQHEHSRTRPHADFTARVAGGRGNAFENALP